MNIFKNLLLSNYKDDSVFVQPFPRNLEENKEGIVFAMSNIDGGMIQRVWDEVDSRTDVRHVTLRSAYWAFVKLRRNCGNSFTSCIRLHVRVILVYWVTNFWKCLVLFELPRTLQIMYFEYCTKITICVSTLWKLSEVSYDKRQ